MPEWFLPIMITITAALNVFNMVLSVKIYRMTRASVWETRSGSDRVISVITHHCGLGADFRLRRGVER